MCTAACVGLVVGYLVTLQLWQCARRVRWSLGNRLALLCPSTPPPAFPSPSLPRGAGLQLVRGLRALRLRAAHGPGAAGRSCAVRFIHACEPRVLLRVATSTRAAHGSPTAHQPPANRLNRPPTAGRAGQLPQGRAAAAHVLLHLRRLLVSQKGRKKGLPQLPGV
jgi:hypothetical protein